MNQLALAAVYWGPIGFTGYATTHLASTFATVAVEVGRRTYGTWGRLNVGKDVPARLAAVLPRSNRVLTLRRILQAQPETRISADESRRVEDSMHPILVAALAEDQHRRCPCGAATQLPYRLCRGCRRQRREMQDRVTAPSRCSPLNTRPFRSVLVIARVLSLLQSISKGCRG